MEAVRLNKFLAQCGICSRRDADKLLEQGAVTVNGKVAFLGQSVMDTDEIKVHHKVVQKHQEKVVLAYYKPIGVTCTEKDKNAEKKVCDMIKYPIRVTYAGRLDKNSEGLLLLTNDGDLIHAMMQGIHRQEKEYIVKVQKEVTSAFLRELEKGVYLQELNITTRPCNVEKIGKYTFRIVLTQGINRQIRRMCHAFGYEVKSLKRIRVINITLEDLKQGQYREIQGEPLQQLYKKVGLL